MQQNSYRFQLLAPLEMDGIGLPLPCARNPKLYGELLASMQKLRARVYLKDKAIKEEDIDQFGRHRMDDDESCWHLLLVDSVTSEVVGCARYLLHSASSPFEDLRLRHCSLAHDATWGSKLRSAIKTDLRLAKEFGLAYAELGGWALAERYRNTRAALEILLGSYAWGQLIGNCICSCTATVRNRSSSILRRIGGMSLVYEGESLPPYYDPNYGCLMEVLRFDSRSPENRFRPLLDELKIRLRNSACIGDGNPASINDEISFTRSLASLSEALKPSVVPERIDRSTLEKV